MRHVIWFVWVLVFGVACEGPPTEKEGQSTASDPPQHDYKRAAIDSVATEIPDRVVLTWSDDPATTASVTWRTEAAVDSGAAEIAVADASPNFVFTSRRQQASTEPFEQNGYGWNSHSVTFRDLKPNTIHAYRVGHGNVWSEWFHFRTARDEPAPFTFAYFGDAQNNVLSLWSRTVRTAYQHAPLADFFLHAGDLINRANKDSDWAEWFEAGDFIHASTPVVATPGNHEYAKVDSVTRRLSNLWRPTFTFPRNGPPGLEETVYYIDYQGTRIVSLNTSEQREIQTAWVRDVLRDNPNRWTIVTFHHPIFSTGGSRDNKELRAQWKPVFDELLVDLVLQGHDHTYGRGTNVSRGRTVWEAGKGTMYVVSVSGPKMYGLTEQEWYTKAAANTQLFQVISVGRDTLDYVARTATGERYDAFQLVKRSEGPNQVIETMDPPAVDRRHENTLSAPEGQRAH